MARVAIIGPGAIGGVMAARLHRTGRHEIIVCARHPLDRLEVEAKDETIAFQPRMITDPRQAEPVDWILVATKAYDAGGAAAWFTGLRTSSIPVAILQNGVEHVERFSKYCPAERILPVVVNAPAERASPGHIRQRGKARLTVPEGALGREFQALFADSGVEVSLTSDFKSAAWKKLCLNTAGALPALLRNSAAIQDDPQIADLARQMVVECMAVARAEDAVLEPDLPDTLLEICRKAPRDSINSLHADRLAARPLEIDARNGVIVRLGRKHRIATPLNAMAVSLLASLSRSERE